MTKSVALNIENLTVGYKEPLFANLNLTLQKGQFITIMGENGSGKSTLIDCLLGNLAPHRGSIQFWGRENHRADRGWIQQRVGWVISQQEAFAPWLKVSDVISATRGLYATWNDRLLAQLAERFRLDLNKRMGHLSSGEGSKVRLIKAMAFEPQLLILDELTANLSPDSKSAIVEALIDRFASGEMAVLYICHSHEEAFRLSDQVLTLTRAGLISQRGAKI